MPPRFPRQRLLRAGVPPAQVDTLAAAFAGYTDDGRESLTRSVDTRSDAALLRLYGGGAAPVYTPPDPYPQYVLPSELLDPASEAGAALRAAYDPGLRSGIYNLKAGHLLRARAALGRARAGSGYARLAFFGDSTVAGMQSSNVATKAWPQQLRSYLIARGYPSAGSGLVTPYNGDTSTADPRWTDLTGWAEAGRRTFRLNGSATPAVFTSTDAGTAVDVYYGQGLGPFTVTIDGGAPATVTPTGADALGIYTATGLPNTTHTVTITRTTSTDVQFFGIAVRTGTSGVYVLNGGIGGSISDDLTGTHWSNVPGFGSLQWGADFIGLCCQVNDTGAGVPVATQKANLQTAITTAKAGGASVLLLTGAPWGTQDLTAYTQAHYELADANDIPLLDMQRRWNAAQSVNASLGLMSGDTIHPADAGYADIGVAVAELILAA